MSSEQYDPSYPQTPAGPAQGQPQGWGQQGWEQQQYAPAPYGAQYPVPGQQPMWQPGYGYPMPVPQSSNGVGIAGFVTGLVGLVLCWVPWLGVLLAIVGVALSGVGIAQGKKRSMSNGLAIAGLVCGIIGLIPSIIIMVAFLSVATQFS